MSKLPRKMSKLLKTNITTVKNYGKMTENNVKNNIIIAEKISRLPETISEQLQIFQIRFLD